MFNLDFGMWAFLLTVVVSVCVFATISVVGKEK